MLKPWLEAQTGGRAKAAASEPAKRASERQAT